jgi:adenosylhomocysteine nucleosidase
VLPRPLLVFFAVKEEARFFTPPKGVTIRVTGMGKRNARAACQEALSQGTARAVLTCGFAGGLDPALSRGTIVFSQDAPLPIHQHLRRAGAVPVQFFCSERVLVTARQKSELRQFSSADAVEMESGVICATCLEKGVPSAVVRVILDLAEEDLPLDFNAFMDAHDRISHSRVIWGLARRPRQIGALIKFQRQTTVAAKKLGEFLGQVAGC